LPRTVEVASISSQRGEVGPLGRRAAATIRTRAVLLKQRACRIATTGSKEHTRCRCHGFGTQSLQSFTIGIIVDFGSTIAISTMTREAIITFAGWCGAGFPINANRASCLQGCIQE
jgi:hypothetical protein